jgi:hypothetical protein
MIRKTTIDKINSLLDSITKSGLSINAYFNSEGKSPAYFYNLMCKLKQEPITSDIKDILEKYNSIKYRGSEIDNLYNETSEPTIP